MDEQTERILERLRHDGRASYSNLSRELGIDRNHIARQVGELLETGELKVMASVHPEILGLTLYAHLAIRTIGPIHDLVEHLRTTDSAILVTETTGPHQVVADLLLTDVAELHLNVQLLRSRPDVVDIAVDIYEEVRDNFFRGTRPEPGTTPLDTEDIEIIRILRGDGRRPYTEIAEQVGLSASSARARVQRLVSRHIIHIGAIRQRTHMNRDLLFGFGICVKGSAEPVIALLSRHPGIEFLATTSGRFDLIATIGFVSLQELDALMTELRAQPTFVFTDHWLHTKIVQERYDRVLGVLADARQILPASVD